MKCSNYNCQFFNIKMKSSSLIVNQNLEKKKKKNFKKKK